MYPTEFSLESHRKMDAVVVGWHKVDDMLVHNTSFVYA